MALDMRFDSRLVKRNLAKGVITQEEYDAHLASLADAASKAETLELVQPLISPGTDAEGADVARKSTKS